MINSSASEFLKTSSTRSRADKGRGWGRLPARVRGGDDALGLSRALNHLARAEIDFSRAAPRGASTSAAGDTRRGARGEIEISSEREGRACHLINRRPRRRPPSISSITEALPATQRKLQNQFPVASAELGLRAGGLGRAPRRPPARDGRRYGPMDSLGRSLARGRPRTALEAAMDDESGGDGRAVQGIGAAPSSL